MPLRMLSAMRSSLILAALVVLITTPLSAQRTRYEDVVQSRTLGNGLQVITVRNASVPFVTVEMVVRIGAFVHASEEEAGYPHLIEHLLLRNDDFEKTASDIDASWNGATSEEATRYYFVFPSKHLADGLAMVSKTIRKGDFSERAIKEESKVVQGELERRASEPEQLLSTTSDMLLWDASGWQTKNAGGNLLALRLATPQKLEALHRRFYVPNNAALVVTGDVTDSAVFALAAKHFEGWRRGPDPLGGVSLAPIAALSGVQRKVLTADVNDVTFLVSWHGPSVRRDGPATHAADLLAALVNQRASRPQVRLVDSGLVDDVSLSYQALDQVGPLELRAHTSPDRAVAAATALEGELRQLMQSGYFTDPDLALAKKLFDVSAVFGLERSTGTAHDIAAVWSSAGLDYFLSYPEKVRTQTLADVERFVSNYLSGKPFTIVVMIPESAWTSIGVPLQRTIAGWSDK
jgi:zinc protease